MVPTPLTAAVLVNLVGFLLGVVLYGLLLGMVLGSRLPASGTPLDAARRRGPTPRLLLITGLLGLTWNLGALVVYGFHTTPDGTVLPWLLAASFTALGFLPAVVVHSVLLPGEAAGRPRISISVGAAYALSAVAAVLHARAALHGVPLPSPTALDILTVGYAVLMVLLLVSTRAARHEGRTIWVVALSVFAVSALHLGQHTGVEAWWTEVVGHHASLPLALAILLRDYRFALADIFLKRALALTLLLGAVLAVHVGLGVSGLAGAVGTAALSAPATTYLLLLVVVAVLLHDPARAASAWFVDTVVLQRPDYAQLTQALQQDIALRAEPEAVLTAAAAQLAHALDASSLAIRQMDGPLPAMHAGIAVVTGSALDALRRDLHLRPVPSIADTGAARPESIAAAVVIPTVDAPTFVWLLGGLMGGRRLLSDDLALAESAAFITARRLDALRVAHERFAATLREQQISQLATEAELRALRAQLNPHFLFNALTTIGYLIQTAPGRAQTTLLRLTSLLRGVLRRTTSEFASLGEEIELVHAYLEIEEARFEERLRVTIDVPTALYPLRVPSLLLQPLVENAVKHGIAPLAAGGDVSITARLAPDASPEAGAHSSTDSGVPAGISPTGTSERALHIVIRDTGAGTTPAALAHGRRHGLGITSVEHRLRTHYGERARLEITGAHDQGTTVEIVLPVAVPRAVAPTPALIAP